jgi:hypothetical protein
MKSDHPVRIFLVAFLLALVGYVTFYAGIEHRRARNGPWEVTFTTNSDGSPTIVVDQTRLGVAKVQIAFPGASLPATRAAADAKSGFTNNESRVAIDRSGISNYPLPITLVFNQPRPLPYDVPFGQCIFMDLISLPGTVTFKLFGHEIELLPRVLVIDHQEHPWRPDSKINLPRLPEGPTEMPPVKL